LLRVTKGVWAGDVSGYDIEASLHGGIIQQQELPLIVHQMN
jgi:hypothetical protein